MTVDVKPKTPSEPQVPKGLQVALIHNFCGVMFRHLDAVHGIDRFERAEKSFELAAKAFPDWYLPHENLADCQSMRGVLEGDIALQDRAQKHYQHALEKVPKAVDGIHPRVKLTSAQAEKVATQLRVAKSIAVMISDPTPPPNPPEPLPDFATELDHELLYTWGCWFATKWRLAGNAQSDRVNAGLYLVAAILRRRDYGPEILDDPDLSKLDHLKELVDAARAVTPVPSTTEDFKNRVSVVLGDAGWLPPPEEGSSAPTDASRIVPRS